MDRECNIDRDREREKAVEVCKKTQEYNKINFDKHRKKSYEYGKGDFVMVKNFIVPPGVNAKTYSVDEVFANDRLKIVDVPGCQLTQIPFNGIVSTEDVKPYAPDLQSETIESQDDRNVDD